MRKQKQETINMAQIIHQSISDRIKILQYEGKLDKMYRINSLINYLIKMERGEEQYITTDIGDITTFFRNGVIYKDSYILSGQIPITGTIYINSDYLYIIKNMIFNDKIEVQRWSIYQKTEQELCNGETECSFNSEKGE